MKLFKSTLHAQRFSLGLICGLLPILCCIFGLIFYKFIPQSISITYYYNFNIIMISALILCSFFLFTYQGYDLGDRIFTILSGIGAFGVAAFPMEAPEFWHSTNVGLFSLPDNVSDILHLISAALVFGCFGLMTITQFTKGKHKRRNILYYICGIVMLLCLVLLGLGSIIPCLAFKGYVMLYELIMLEAFALSWLVKSAVFFKDKSNKNK